MNARILACALAGALCFALPARASTNTETLGTGVAIALPVVAGGITLWKDDFTGSAQLLTSTFLTVGTVYGLKHFVRECRPFATPCAPNSPNWNSFPSDTSALAFAPAQFLWQRYGWQYGVPAYAAAAFVGWSRVDAKQHHWWDVATSAAISLGYNELITTRYRPRSGFYSDLQASPDGVYASLNYRW
ncbi:MAG: phosphatase PAP2 family protein [Alphaproteobacteria bacterium]|nr:phosphatase PAP2 family protein [Alphaproteobacteria bacterium]MDE2630167.1 phosphatase PAP2 family protein [Alphaproteobacteria bacterium]